MKSNFLFGSILAAALTVGVGAQAPTAAPQDPASPQPSREQPMAKSSSDSVTVTGCIQADTAAATGTSGSTSPAGGASSKAESFILANVSSGSSGAAAGTAGTTGASAPTASQYKLTGKSDDLKKYVNSKVEIKGKVDSGSGAAASSSSSGPTLRVDSVKQLSPSCSQ